MASSHETTVSQRSLYLWDPIFDSRRIVSDRLDEPFVDVRNDVEAETDLISCFMQVYDENDSCHHATDLVAGFCRGADLQSLQQNSGEAAERVALLDDSGGLTAWDLYHALKKPKKAPKSNMFIRNGRIYHRKGKINKLETGIRQIYIATLNRWSILALAASAPNQLAGIIGRFIFKHLQFDPLINAKILPIGLPVFALEFHLPYFPLRKHRIPQKDNRPTVNGGILRGYQDISFLRTMGSKLDNSLTEYVYEAKLSCLVCGSSRHSWYTYLFNDLYFETDEDSESIEGYHDERSSGSMPDPFTAGKRDRLPREPREFFLMILEIRLRKVKKEWEQLCRAVDEAIQTYRDSYSARTSWTAESGEVDTQKTRVDADKQRSQLREELQEWMRRSVEFLRKLIGTLKQYTKEWERFRNTGMNYFMSTDNPERSARLVKSLAAVDQEFEDLGRLLPKLGDIMDCLCEDMSREVSLRIAHESNESALFQQRTATDLKILTWITFLSLPLALVSNLLSTQEGYIPTKPSPWAFFVWVIILEILIWAILVSLLGWGWFMERVNGVWHRLGIGDRRVEKDIELRQLEGLN